MIYVQVTVNDKTHYLLKQPNGTWLFTHRSPVLNGVGASVIEITNENTNMVINTNDEVLLSTIRNLMLHNQSARGNMMLNYYPQVIKVLLEYQVLIQATGFEIDFFKSEFNLALNDTYLHTMGEERIVEWEKALGVTPAPNNSLEDRREVIMARFRGGYKLNTESISNVVRTFTNNDAESRFEDSTVYVEILAPANNKQYKFDNVERELRRRIPAHLDLVVTRKYATWGEIKDNFSSWKDVHDKFNSWEDVYFYVAPRP